MTFVFAVVRSGSEAWAKDEVARARPGWRFGYGRAGLVTWKRDDAGDAANETPETVVARVWGRGIGPAASVEDVIAMAGTIEGALRLHVFAGGRRDEDEPSEEGEARAREVEAGLRAALGSRALEGARAQRGDRVLDVVVGERDFYVGVHQHREGAVAWAGGRIPVALPEDAPSRAYRKIEEMIEWAGLPVREGDVAVEIGAAPGGAAYALARRGVSVLAIDPAAMDEKVLAYVGPGGARISHVAAPVGAITREQLPEGARWLLSDLNLAPPVSLRYCERIARAIGASLEGAVLTLKMNDAKMIASIPTLLERAATIVPGGEARAIQLPAHRREIGVVVRRSAARRGADDRGARAPRGAAPRRAPRTR